MTREEMLELRDRTLARLGTMRRLSDYSAEAPDIRETSEALLLVIEHLLERMRRT